MNVTVRITRSFKIAVKPLIKKYPSLHKDLLQLENELIHNPKLGVPLGQNTYKIRLKISGKAKGKSGGARVISLIEQTLLGQVQINETEITVNLITIYDKADIDSISNQ